MIPNYVSYFPCAALSPHISSYAQILKYDMYASCLFVIIWILKRPCIEFDVVRRDSAIVVCIHSAIIQLLLTRRVRYC